MADFEFLISDTELKNIQKTLDFLINSNVKERVSNILKIAASIAKFRNEHNKNKLVSQKKVIMAILSHPVLRGHPSLADKKVGHLLQHPKQISEGSRGQAEDKNRKKFGSHRR
ncbi:MAG: hypothetical protein NUV57_06555 [archaeon]|nr:hypothetical protein [archaeon]